MTIRRFTLPTLAATGALAVVGLTAGAASAHVTVTPSTTTAGAYTVLTFGVPHGCEGSPTTKVSIGLPEEILAVTPTVNPGWTVEKVTEKLPDPIEDADGNQLTERVSQVVYQARTPLPADLRDTLELSLQLPEDAEGQTLAFPVIQTCAKGRTDWVETPASGQDAEELEHPAPAVAVTGAEDDAVAGSGTTGRESEAQGDDDNDDNDGTALGVVGVALGAVGTALGAVALARSRKRV